MIHDEVGRGENFDFAVEFFGVWHIKETRFEPEDCGYDMELIVRDIIENAWARYEFGEFYGVGK